MLNTALTHAMAVLAERYLDQEPHSTCIICRWNSAVSAQVFLPDSQEDGMVRGAVLPLCGPCLCSEDLPGHIEQALRMARAKGQDVWN
jgi:hypothetical protein